MVRRLTSSGGTLRSAAALLVALVGLLALAAPAVAQTVTGVSPDAGVPGGATSVTIIGSGFTGATEVDFGTGNSAPFMIDSDGQITATSPPGSGTVDVTVTADGTTSATSPADQYTYENAPTVTGLSSSAGPLKGGTSVTITGTNLTDATGVSFGATPATSFTVVNSTKITTTSPGVAQAGTVDVTVTTPVATSDVNPPGDQFSYDPVPAVTNVQPNAGPLAGGTSVAISGSGFTGATAVDFGNGQSAAQFTVNSDSSITATSPPGSGTVSITVTTTGGTSASGGSAEEFTYAAAPGVTGVSPNTGPLKGGTSVTISGTGFTGATKVMFGSTAATSFKVNSDAQITASSPPTSHTGSVDVTVTTADGTSATGSADLFTYDAVPTVSSVSPRAGPLSGGATFTINGTGFTGASTVAVGPNAATVLTVSSTQITAQLPAATNTGTVNVTVTTPGGTSATSSADDFTYDSVPVVASVSPAVGPAGGGTSVTINGSGFTGATAVDFAGVQASFTFVSDAKITATSPTGSVGAADVTVTTPGGTSATSTADHFTYFPAPAVTGVSPGAGPLAGGTMVTITGTGLTGATAVSFGSSAGTQVTVVSATEVTAVSPGGSAGAVGVTVTTPGGTSSLTPPDRDQDFTYTNGPTITSLTPAAGPLAGGTAVTIIGTNLANASVAFGSTDVTPTSSSATSITVTSPPASQAGEVNVVVSTAGGNSPTTGTASQFSYDSVPTVAGITPSDGLDTGGTKVTVTGSGFSTGSTTVAFGAKAAQSVTVISDAELTATAPAEAIGTIDIRVTTPGGTSAASSADQYTFTPLPKPAIVKLSPSIGPLGGGTKVTISGSKFTGATAVKFGAEPALSYVVDSDTEITAVSPPLAAGTVDVTITTPVGGTSEAVAADRFTYERAPDVSIGPASLAQRRATVRGSVNPNGLPVIGCEFQYGTTGVYGHAAPCSFVTVDSSGALVSAKLNGLEPGARYHYRLVVTTASGTTRGPDWTFSTNPLPVVGTPLIGLLLERRTRPAGFIGKLLGVQGISRAAIGERIVVRCIVACSGTLSLRIHLVNRRSMRRRVSLPTAFPLSTATRIEIDVSAPGKLSRYARYSFTPAGRSIAVHITRSGCLSPAGLIAGCPRAPG
jgi:IPT/TIG domain